SATQNRLPSALEGPQERECPICATHGLNALTSGKHRTAGPGERPECQSFLENNGRQKAAMRSSYFPFIILIQDLPAQDCENLRIDWRNSECGSGIRTPRVETRRPFCLLNFSIIREGG